MCRLTMNNCLGGSNGITHDDRSSNSIGGFTLVISDPVQSARSARAPSNWSLRRGLKNRSDFFHNHTPIEREQQLAKQRISKLLFSHVSFLPY